MWAEPMSSLARVSLLVAVAALLGTALPTLAPAEPLPKATQQTDARKPASCGELPRASRAYKDCIAAQSRRDAPAAGQPGVKPVFSSR
jgi:hypothetical protein